MRKDMKGWPDEALTIDNCDSAIIGVARRCGCIDLVVYDYDLLVEAFMDQEMTEEEAVEWIDYNVAGAWVGHGTPLILYRCTAEELPDMLM